MPHVRTSVRGLRKTGRSPIKGPSFVFPPTNRMRFGGNVVGGRLEARSFRKLLLRQLSHGSPQIALGKGQAEGCFDIRGLGRNRFGMRLGACRGESGSLFKAAIRDPGGFRSRL